MRCTKGSSFLAAVVALCCVGVLAAPARSLPRLGAPTVGDGASASDRAVLEDCLERFVIVPGIEERVREAVPPAYELSRNARGQPLLFVGAGRCERYTVDDATNPTTWAAFAASIQSPDGVGCFSGWPVVGEVAGGLSSCNFYLLFVAYDQPAVVEFWREGVPDSPVHFVPDLVFEQDALDPTSGGAPFRFVAEAPTPSPFSLDLTVRETPGERPLTAGFWFTDSAGTTVRARVEIGEWGSGQAAGNVQAAPGSQMAELFGTESPAPEPVFSFLAGNRWRYGEITKSVLPADA